MNQRDLEMFRKGDESDSDSDVEAKPKVSQRDVGSTESQEPSTITPEDASGSDEEGGLFGNMMDLPDPNAAADLTESSETSHLKIRDLAVPKHLPSAFVLPKKLLSEMLYANTKTKAASAGSTKDPVLRAIPPKLSIVKLDYTDISKGSRAKRVKLEVEWSPDIGAGKDLKSNGSKNSRSGSSTPKKPAGSRAEPLEGMSGLSLNNVIPGSGKTTSQPPTLVKPSYKYLLEMTTTACATLVEAENYISLVLLHELTTSTPHSQMLETKSAGLGIELPRPPKPPTPAETVKDTSNQTKTSEKSESSSNTAAPPGEKKKAVEEPPKPEPLPPLEASVPLWIPEYPPVSNKYLPLPYRDVWDELEKIRSSWEDLAYRQVWRKLDGLMEDKAGVTGEASTEDKEETNESSVPGPSKAKARKGRMNGQSATSMEPDQRILDAWQNRSNSQAYKKMMVRTHLCSKRWYSV